MTQRVGVEAVFDVTEFTKGLNAYVGGLNAAEAATNKFATNSQKAINDLASGINATLTQTGGRLSQFATEFETFLNRVKAPTSNGLDKAVATVNDDLQQTTTKLNQVAKGIERGVDAFVQTNQDIIGKQRTFEVITSIGQESAQLVQNVAQAEQQAKQNIQTVVQEAFTRTPNDAAKLVDLAKQATAQAAEQNRRALDSTIASIKATSIGPTTSDAVAAAVTQLKEAVRASNAEVNVNLKSAAATVQSFVDAQKVAAKQGIDTKILQDVGTISADALKNINAARTSTIAQIQQAATAASTQGYADAFAAIKNTAATIKQVSTEADKEVQGAIEGIRKLTLGTNLAPQIGSIVENLRTQVSLSNQQLGQSLTESAAVIRSAMAEQRTALETEARNRGVDSATTVSAVGKQGAELVAQLTASKSRALAEIQQAVTQAKITSTTDPTANIEALKASVAASTKQNDDLVDQVARTIRDTTKGQKMGDLTNQIVADLRSTTLQTNAELNNALRAATTEMKAAFQDQAEIAKQSDAARVVKDAGAKATQTLTEITVARDKAIADIEAAVRNAAKLTPSDAHESFAQVARANQALIADIENKVKTAANQIRGDTKGEGVSDQVNQVISDLRASGKANADTIANALKTAASQVSNISSQRQAFDPSFVVKQAQTISTDLINRVQAAQAQAITEITNVGALAATQAPQQAKDTVTQLRQTVAQIVADTRAETQRTVDLIRSSAQGPQAKAAVDTVISSLRAQITQSNQQLTNTVKQTVTQATQQSQQANRDAARTAATAQAAAAQTQALDRSAKEIAEFIKRLNETKQQTVAAIQQATVQAANKALKPSEFNDLRNTIRNNINGIYRDLQLTINNIRGLTSGTGLTGRMGAEFINLRSTVKSAVGDIYSSLGQLRSQTASTGNIISDLVGNKIKSLLSFAVVAQAVQLLTSAFNKLTAAARSGIDSVVFFERLGFALQTNMAIEIRKAADYTIDMVSALDKAQASAGGLFREVEKIALFSQFTFRDVAEVVKTANAYGFTSDQVLRLTQALADLGAARGLEPQQLNLVQRAIGQIITKGKLYQQEINQLGENGINLIQILEEEGVATEEFIRQQQRKNEPVADAIVAVEALVSNTEKNFGGTSKRLAFSLGGLLSTVQEIGQILSREFFGGLLRGLEPVLRVIAEFATTDEFRANLTVFGEVIAKGVTIAIQALAEAFGILQIAWSWIPPAFQKGFIIANLLRIPLFLLIGTFGLLASAIAVMQTPLIQLTTILVFTATQFALNFDAILNIVLDTVEFVGFALGTLADDMVEWGANIAEAFADGIIGALDFVIDAINFIGEAITYLLIPGSPPRLLPDLDKWGTEAAEVYLAGWTTADFSILDKISNEFKSFFSALAQQGKIDEVSIPGMVIGVKEELAQAIAELRQFGEISAETLGNIGQVGGEFGEILTGYVTRYAALALATDAATVAQEKLNAITKQYDEILKPLQRRLAVIQDQRQTADEAKRERQLQNIIRSSYVSEARRTQAQLELEELRISQKIRGTELEKSAATDAAQAQVDATSELQKKLEEEFSLFEARVAQQTGINQLLGEQQRLLDQLAKENLRKAKEEMDKQVKAIQIQRDEMNDLIRIAEIRYRLEHDTLTQAERQLFNLELQAIELERINRAKEAGELGVDLGPLQDVPITPEDFLSKSELKDLGEVADVTGGKLAGVINPDLEGKYKRFQEIVDQQRHSWERWGLVIEGVVDKFKRAFGIATEKPDTTFFDPDFVFGRKRIDAFFVGDDPNKAIPTLAESIATSFMDGFSKAFDAEIEKRRDAIFDKFKTLFGLEDVDSTYNKQIGRLIGAAIIEGTLATIGLRPLGKLITSSLLGEREVVTEESKLKGIVIGTALLKGTLDGLVGKPTSDLLTEWTLSMGTEIGPQSDKNKFHPTGKLIALGLIKGVLGGLLGQPTADLIFEWLVAWQTYLKIASPSKLFQDDVGGPIGQGIIDGVVSSLTSGLEAVKGALVSLKDTVLNFFGFGKDQPAEDTTKQTNALADQKDLSLLILTELRDGAAVLIESIRTTTEQMFTGLKDTLVGEGGTVPTMTASILSAISKLSANMIFQTLLQNTALTGQYTLLKTDLVGESGIISQIASSFISLFKKMGDDAILKISTFIVDLMELLTGEEGLLGRLQTEFVDEGLLLGENFALGLAQGIMNKIEEVRTAAQAVADAAVATASTSLETGSPSARAARELGEPFSLGVAQGMLSQMNALAEASSLIISQLFGFADTVEQRLGLTPSSSSVTNSSSRTNVFNLSVATQQSTGGVVQDFGTMRAFAGA